MVRPLPWPPQQAAQRACVGAAVTPTEGVSMVWARESIPAGPSIFLARPTPADGEVPSWRPSAIAALKSRWPALEPLTVLTPESRLGERAKEYHDQLEWEAAALDAATAIIFWIPRDLDKLPGFTTNVEFGLHVRSGRVVLGAPADLPEPGAQPLPGLDGSPPRRAGVRDTRRDRRHRYRDARAGPGPA
jgi:hypothetical protein